jgi:hypothetical protein
LNAVVPHLTPLQVAAINKLLSSPDRLALRAVAISNIPVFGTTLGKHLLLGTSWKAELDLADQPSALIYFKRIGSMP